MIPEGKVRNRTEISPVVTKHKPTNPPTNKKEFPQGLLNASRITNTQRNKSQCEVNESRIEEKRSPKL